MAVIAELSVLPIGTTSTSLSQYVAEAVKALSQIKGIKFQVGPMGSTIEAGTLDKVFQATKAAHEAVFNVGAARVITFLSIDDRRDVKHTTMVNKVKAIERIVKARR